MCILCSINFDFYVIVYLVIIDVANIFLDFVNYSNNYVNACKKNKKQEMLERII